MNGTTQGNPLPQWRLVLTYTVMLVLVSVFIGRLYQLQVLDRQQFVAAAEDNRLNTVNVPAARGVIYDRNDSLLVRNIPVYNVNVTAALLPESEAENQAIFETISRLTGVPLDQEGEPTAKCVPGRGILQLVEEGASLAPYSPWPVACDIGEQTARVMQQLQVDMPGVSVEAVPVRDYTTGEATAAVIGYLGPIPAADEQRYIELGFDPNRDKVGYAGIEGQYQTVLAGTNGRKIVEVDVAGQQIREVGQVVQPTPGNNLKLTIDTRLQTAAETA
ncbi:MAG: hypothetical protein WBR18_09880, partial [Anaerolineales bacterium]